MKASHTRFEPSPFSIRVTSITTVSFCLVPSTWGGTILHNEHPDFPQYIDYSDIFACLFPNQGLSTLLSSFSFQNFALLSTRIHFFKSNPTICTISRALAPCKMHHQMYNAVLIELQQNTQQIKGTFHYELTHPLPHSTILTLKPTLHPVDKSLFIALRSNGCSARIHLSETAGF